MEQLKFNIDNIGLLNQKKKQASGYFKYTEHYSYDGADNIYISMLKDKVKIIVTTPDNVFTRSNFTLNMNQLLIIANSITLAWKNNSVNFNTEFNSCGKHISIYTSLSKNNTIDGYKYDKNKHLSIKINNKTVIYGFDINDSRRLYKLLIELIKYGKSEELC